MRVEDMRSYADLILSSVALQPDRSSLIQAEPAHWSFVTVLAELAYTRGARYVHVSADHADLYSCRVENSSPEHLAYVPAWHNLEHRTMIDDGWALISIKSPEDPDALRGLDPTRHGMVQNAQAEATLPPTASVFFRICRPKRSSQCGWRLAGVLGELALVDTASPIYQSGLVFYNALYDENAACHIALGSSYPKCIVGGDQMSDGEYQAAGGNRSTVHTDVMFSSPEVDVIGETRSGADVEIIRAGSSAIQDIAHMNQNFRSVLAVTAAASALQTGRRRADST